MRGESSPRSSSKYYGEFSLEIVAYFSSIGYTPNLIDQGGGEKLIRLLESTDLKEKTRSIVSRYSRRIADVLRK
jgi:hypothetical protein